jgi:hypothetical protein
VSGFGAKKYEWKNWRKVEDGINRYSNGLGRHLVQEGIEKCDQESGKLHAAHAAWNALARLELMLYADEVSTQQKVDDNEKVTQPDLPSRFTGVLGPRAG